MNISSVMECDCDRSGTGTKTGTELGVKLGLGFPQIPTNVVLNLGWGSRTILELFGLNDLVQNAMNSWLLEKI